MKKLILLFVIVFMIILFVASSSYRGQDLKVTNKELQDASNNYMDGKYGALLWLNLAGEYPGVLADLFYCDGYDGQYIFIPSKHLVIVRTGCSPNDSFDQKTFLKGIVDSLE